MFQIALPFGFSAGRTIKSATMVYDVNVHRSRKGNFGSWRRFLALPRFDVSVFVPANVPLVPSSQRDSRLPDGEGRPAGVHGQSAAGRLKESESSLHENETR